MRCLLLPLALFSSSLMAQSEIQPGTALEPISSPFLLKLTAGLVLVVAIIFLLGWMLKKFNLNQHSANGLIRVVAGLSIGTRDRIVLLQVGEEQILVGLTPGRIEKIHSLKQPLELEEAVPVSASFAAKLNRLMGERESS